MARTSIRPVALITGARTGIGLELTRRLLVDGWDVITLTRAALPYEAVFIEATAQGRLRQYECDLADFASLRRAVGEIVAQETAIDILFNNAGVNPAISVRSPQGRDLCFEVNVLAPYILAQELRSRLARGKCRRIVNISSGTLLMVTRFSPNKLGSGKNFGKLFGAYATSKLALSLWTDAAVNDFKAQGISIVSADPGATKSPLSEGKGRPWWLRIIARFAFKPPAVAVARLHEVAFETRKYPSGSFVRQGKVRRLPYGRYRDDVLDCIDRIYRQDYKQRAGHHPDGRG